MCLREGSSVWAGGSSSVLLFPLSPSYLTKLFSSCILLQVLHFSSFSLMCFKSSSYKCFSQKVLSTYLYKAIGLWQYRAGGRSQWSQECPRGTSHLPCRVWLGLTQTPRKQTPIKLADCVKIAILLKTDVFGAGIGAGITLCSLPALCKHPQFLAQLCFLPSWQKPWLWSMGIKLRICCSQVLFCRWDSHLREIIPEKCFYL